MTPINIIFSLFFSAFFSFSAIAEMDAAAKIVPLPKKHAKAVAVLFPTEGNTVSGYFLFEQKKNGVQVYAQLQGLTPNASHGVHIHTYGDLRDMKTGKSAGGHYNPEGHSHGLPPNLKRHAGSFGNVVSNKYGEANFELFDQTFTIAGFKNPVLGRAVVVHAKPDTGAQPAGNAGARIGLGVIGLVP
jgi:superoxide dismutase, Cu-Zn family